MKRNYALVLICILSLFSSASFADSYTILTGVPDSNGTLVYSPSYLSVEVGDTVIFQFFSGSVHTTFYGGSFPSFTTNAANPSHMLVMNSTGYRSYYDANQPNTIGGGINITHSSACSADMTFTSNNPSQLSWQFNGTATGTPPFSYYWDFGDGHTDSVQNPTHTYASNGIYGPCLTITDASGCVQYDCDTVFAGNSFCSVNFSSSDSANTVFFNIFSQGNITSYTWDYGDGTTATHSANQPTPTHTYANPGTYTVCLVGNSSNCSDTICHTVTVTGSGSNCLSNFTSTVSGLMAVFSNQSTPNHSGMYYYWDFGDGHSSFQENPVHNYASSGTYNVCLQVYDSLNNCLNTACQPLTISSGSSCHANFSAHPDTSNMGMMDYYFAAHYQGSSTTSYVWDFGDGTTGVGPYPYHSYSNPGFYVACLTVTDSTPNGNICTDTYCDSVLADTVFFLSVPNFRYQTSGNGATVSFTNETYTWGFRMAALDYAWDFGDGNSSTLEHPTHTYAQTGTYEVCLEVTDPSTGYSRIFCDDNVVAAPTSIEDVSIQNLKLYPNPAVDQLKLSWKNSQTDQLSIQLYNHLGAIISAQTLSVTAGQQQHLLDLSKLPSGLYQVVIGGAAHKTTSHSIVKQ